MSATMTAETAYCDRTLADIVTMLPGATSVFRGRKLDFCCGGQETNSAPCSQKLTSR